MRCSEYYMDDVLRFFEGRSPELALYENLFGRLEAEFPDAAVRVQKSQISFYGRHLFAAVSLPLRRKRDWPENSILVTFGLSCQKRSPRIAAASEPYPNRWTHHVLVSAAGEIDGELLEWLRESWQFSESKRGGRQ